MRLPLLTIALAGLVTTSVAGADPTPPTGKLLGKLDLTFYGFVELDTIWDSTQGLNELAGNAALARPGTYTGEHGETTFAARNSRLGLKIAEPLAGELRVTGQLEMDFLGNQPPGSSEAALFQNATMRFRHVNLKLETKVVDVLVGQSWQLFGWQSMNSPNTVAIQGIPGQIYSRAPQVRVSKKLPLGSAATLELAVAAARPPQRAAVAPDGHVGIKLTLDTLLAAHTAGSTGSAIDGAAIGVSAVGRRFAVDEFMATPAKAVERNGYGLSIDALVPIIPAASKTDRGNALTLSASFVTGAGIADLYTGLSGGVSEPALPNPDGTSPAPTYTPNVDNGLVLFRADGSLHPIQWTSFLAGLQYYLPCEGKVWVSANASHLSSANADLFGAAMKVFTRQLWWDTNLFVDVTPAVRFGVEYSRTKQTYADATDAINSRVQLSGFLIF